jgi:hypothetical protein
VDSLVFGESQSYTPVANNPRLFVWRDDTQELTLPLLEKEISKSIKHCTVTYENDIAIETDNCRSETQYVDTFAGYKIISIDPSQGDGALSVESQYNFLNQIVNALQSDQNRTYYHEQY